MFPCSNWSLFYSLLNFRNLVVSEHVPQAKRMELSIRYGCAISKVCDHLHLLESHEIDILALSTVEDRRLKDVLLRLQNLGSITNPWQKKDIIMATVCELFNCVIEVYPVSAQGIPATPSVLQDRTLKSVRLGYNQKIPQHFQIKCFIVSERLIPQTVKIWSSQNACHRMSAL